MSIDEAIASMSPAERQARARMEMEGYAAVASLFVAPEAILGRMGVAALRMTNVAEGVAVASRAVALERFGIAKAGLATLERGGGKVIMGPGTKTELREAGRLAKAYGGEAGSYTKVTTAATKTSDGASVQVHAYENMTTGRIYEPKLKIQ